ncbi:trimeric LpxA-like protein [Cladochytrium replicatum]|nr:trimeric LpxA-like protein [Cladochytrium replicatum]
MSRNTVICEEAEVRGHIVMGENNVVHPKCRIISQGSGSIIIGSNNIFEENASIINRTSETLVIGDDNLFEVGCVFEGSSIGNSCIIEAKAVVGRGTTLGSNCIIGAKCETLQDEDIPSDTVIFSGDNERRIQTKATRTQMNLHSRHLEYLREKLPQYHHQKTLAK